MPSRSKRLIINNKGVREYQLIVNYFLRLDRSRGMSYAKLAKIYKLDASNIHKRINGTLNKRYNSNCGHS